MPSYGTAAFFIVQESGITFLDCATEFHTYLLSLPRRFFNPTVMTKELIRKYIWLIDTVNQAGFEGITFSNIRSKWKRALTIFKSTKAKNIW